MHCHCCGKSPCSGHKTHMRHNSWSLCPYWVFSSSSVSPSHAPSFFFMLVCLFICLCAFRPSFRAIFFLWKFLKISFHFLLSPSHLPHPSIQIEEIAEVPLVVEDKIESIQKTKEAVSLLRQVKAWKDVEKVCNSKRFRAGKGKMRNRRRIMRTGPCVIYRSVASQWN